MNLDNPELMAQAAAQPTYLDAASHSGSYALLTTHQIQKILEDNTKLILAIMECNNLGKMAESAEYLDILQENLTYLAAMADVVPPQGSGIASQEPVISGSAPPQETQLVPPPESHASSSVRKQEQSAEPVTNPPPPLLQPNAALLPQEHVLQQQQQQFQSCLGFARFSSMSGMQQIMRAAGQATSGSNGCMNVQGSMQPSTASDGLMKPQYWGVDGHADVN
ncbi:unnamed protein product [Cuscuta epithymum]|uniref:SS18 N-terminal domain-containing protein n=2 Tax=Cuscuta epithymum TaxID=186058 RepID=A0AAV0FNZ8_9ASTE|nr:unnamed protein product [Cuscuta epithymum]